MYTTAPLPFMGQKRRFIKLFKSALDEFPDAKVFVDLFGGSGLLSHITKQVRPNAFVVYNDYDDYHVRLINVEHTNRIIDSFREMVTGCPEDKKLPPETKQAIVSYLHNQEAKHGYIDYITVSSSLLFSMNYAEDLQSLQKQTFYNCVKKNPYNASGYLEGLHIVKHDYKELFHKYKDFPGVVFLVDPPYLSTEKGTYQNYWRLADYLDVLNVLKENSYFYFTSNKSSILELCEWLETNLSAINPFHNSTKKEMHVKVNYASSYTDIMLYKNATVTGSIPDWSNDD